MHFLLRVLSSINVKLRMFFRAAPVLPVFPIASKATIEIYVKMSVEVSLSLNLRRRSYLGLTRSISGC